MPNVYVPLEKAAAAWIAYAFRLVGGEELRAYEEGLERGEPAPRPEMKYVISWKVG